MTATPDRIEKRTVLRAPRSRVWRALTDSSRFATWFGIELAEPFEAGRTVRGTLTMRGQKYNIEFAIDRIEPEHTFSYRWHPYAIDPTTDYSAEPMTLVEFRLNEVADGTELTVVETGFDQIPAHRRDEAYRMNEGGWKSQIEKLRGYVTE